MARLEQLEKDLAGVRIANPQIAEKAPAILEAIVASFNLKPPPRKTLRGFPNGAPDLGALVVKSVDLGFGNHTLIQKIGEGQPVSGVERLIQILKESGITPEAFAASGLVSDLSPEGKITDTSRINLRAMGLTSRDIGHTF